MEVFSVIYLLGKSPELKDNEKYLVDTAGDGKDLDSIRLLVISNLVALV